MSNIKETLQNAVASETSNNRLQTAAGMAGEYLRQRETAAHASAAAAQFAAELLGITINPEAKGGQATARGLEILIRKDPIKAVLVAVAKQDRQLKQDLYWALDASRRSAAVAAYRASTMAATAVEAARMAGAILGDEPYAGAEESPLYPESGHAARTSFEEDSEIWESLALLLSTEADVPRLCRFWVVSGRDFVPVNCDSWEDVESFLAPKN